MDSSGYRALLVVCDVALGAFIDLSVEIRYGKISERIECFFAGLWRRRNILRTLPMASQISGATGQRSLLSSVSDLGHE